MVNNRICITHSRSLIFVCAKVIPDTKEETVSIRDRFPIQSEKLHENKKNIQNKNKGEGKVQTICP